MLVTDQGDCQTIPSRRAVAHGSRRCIWPVVRPGGLSEIGLELPAASCWLRRGRHGVTFPPSPAETQGSAFRPALYPVLRCNSLYSCIALRASRNLRSLRGIRSMGLCWLCRARRMSLA